jgi:hypothetical protein
MKHLGPIARSLVAATMIAVSAPAFAGSIFNPPPRGQGGPTTVAAPEIDANSGALAIALLVGGVLLASERARSRKQ